MRRERERDLKSEFLEDNMVHNKKKWKFKDGQFFYQFNYGHVQKYSFALKKK